MVSKKLMDIVDQFDESIEELADNICLILVEHSLTEDEYYIVRHKIMAKLREDCKIGEIDEPIE